MVINNDAIYTNDREPKSETMATMLYSGRILIGVSIACNAIFAEVNSRWVSLSALGFLENKPPLIWPVRALFKWLLMAVGVLEWACLEASEAG